MSAAGEAGQLVGEEQGMHDGLKELDELLGLDHTDPATRLATINSEASMELLSSLRAARERAGLRQADVADRMGLKSQSSVADIERLGSDPHLSTLRRYANAVGARLQFRVLCEDDVAARVGELLWLSGEREGPDPDSRHDYIDGISYELGHRWA